MKQETQNKMAEIIAAAKAKAAQQSAPITPAPKKAPEEIKTVIEDNGPELSDITVNDLLADNSAPKTESQEPKHNLNFVDYSSKAFAVIGDTYPIKDKLKTLGGKFNYHLTCGAGWIFSKAKYYTVRKALNLI